MRADEYVVQKLQEAERDNRVLKEQLDAMVEERDRLHLIVSELLNIDLVTENSVFVSTARVSVDRSEIALFDALSALKANEERR